jgi:hypothetical protein
MRWGRILAGGIGLIAGAGLAVLGISLAVVTEDVYGEVWHPHGSLGLAVIVTGIALLLAGGWIALAPPSAWLRPWQTVDTPGRLALTGGVLVMAAFAAFAVTAQVGGAIAYSPYDWLGLEMLGLATLMLLRALWWVAVAHPPRRR